MSEELSSGLAATANEPTADTPSIDAALDAAFASTPEPAASSDPSAPSEPAKEPVAAIQQPQDTKPDAGVKGEPPKEKWDQILANARTKAREDAIAEHKDALEIVNRLKSDFAGTLTQLLDEGVADPRFADNLTSRAAAILAARRKAAAEDRDPDPDVQWKADDGSTIAGYSAEALRLALARNAQQVEKKILEQFKPLAELQQQFTSAKQLAHEAQQAQAIAEERGAEWKAMPFFTENSDAILQRQQELYVAAKDQPGFDPINAPWKLLQQAYREVITSQAIPKLQTQQTEKLLAAAAHKKAGSASDPAASLPATPRKGRTPDEVLDQAFAGIGLGVS